MATCDTNALFKSATCFVCAGVPESGQSFPVPTPPGPTPCVNSYFATQDLTGSYNPGAPKKRFSFVPVTNRGLSFFAYTNDVNDMIIDLIAPDGVTVLVHNNHQNGPLIGPAGDTGTDILNVFADSQTYFMDVYSNNAGNTANFNLAISAGPDTISTVSAIPRDNWMLWYSPEVNRIFTLGSYESSLATGYNSVFTSFDSKTNAQKGSAVVNTAGSSGGNAGTGRLLFWNKNDNSAWCQTFDASQHATFNRLDLNATVLETFACPNNPDGTKGSGLYGSFAPTTNTILGFTPELTSWAHIQVFKCGTRTFSPQVALPFTAIAFSICYDSVSDKFYLTISDGGANKAVLTFSSAGVLLTNVATASYVGSATDFLFVLNGLVYGSVDSPGPTSVVSSLNPTTGAITSIIQVFGVSYKMAAYDTCRNCIGFIMEGNTGDPTAAAVSTVYLARATTSGTLLELMRVDFEPLGNDAPIEWPFVVWNPDQSRLAVTSNRNLYML